MKIATDHALAQWLDLVLSEGGPPDRRARLLLAALAIRLRADRRSPSLTELARMTALSPSVIAKLMSNAECEGWLTHEELRRVQATDDAAHLMTSDDLARLQ